MLNRYAASSELRSEATSPAIVATVSAGLGALLAVIWSHHFVDTVISGRIASAALGGDATLGPAAGLSDGLVFAFVTGVAGTFTACNICVFSTVAPLAEENVRSGMARPLCFLCLGAVVTSALYGFVGVLLAPVLPQLSKGLAFGGVYPARLTQASVVFVLVGLVMILWGLVAIGLFWNPFARIAARLPMAGATAMGVLAGSFMVGRPFPLFRTMFEHAAARGDPLYGAAAFVLQMAGNLLLVVIAVLALASWRGGYIPWQLHRTPLRAQAFAAAGFLAGGVFLVLYWGLRVPAKFGLGWWPELGW
jgi:hypothetical protein